MMTLDEAISHCEEIAELNDEKEIEYAGQGMYISAKDCRKCASEHRQLAEWLRELKDFRERLEPQPCEECKFANDNSFCEVCCHNYSSMFADRTEVNADEDSN